MYIRVFYDSLSHFLVNFVNQLVRSTCMCVKFLFYINIKHARFLKLVSTNVVASSNNSTSTSTSTTMNASFESTYGCFSDHNRRVLYDAQDEHLCPIIWKGTSDG